MMLPAAERPGPFAASSSQPAAPEPAAALAAALALSWVACALCLLDAALGPASLYAARIDAARARRIQTNALLVLPALALAALLANPPRPALLDPLLRPLLDLLPDGLRLFALLLAAEAVPRNLLALLPFQPPPRPPRDSVGALALDLSPGQLAFLLTPLGAAHLLLLRLTPFEFGLLAARLLARRILVEFTANLLPGESAWTGAAGR